MNRILELPTVPKGYDQTVYVVQDGLVSGKDIGHTNPDAWESDEHLIEKLIEGQYCNPIRIIAFNTLENWASDQSEIFAAAIQELCDLRGEAVPEYLADFVHKFTTR